MIPAAPASSPAKTQVISLLLIEVTRFIFGQFVVLVVTVP